MGKLANDVIEIAQKRNVGEKEFLQAVSELVHSVEHLVESDLRYKTSKILERMIEPERVISFRVSWMNDSGEIQINRGFRVQMNSAIGPYKGGLRFHPSVNLSILKFLAFEQTFKNALTSCPIGGGKGGSDFDPKGKSDNEIMRFCQSFMTELQRHIGHNIDVPAGDMGVGSREIGYLYGQYKRIRNEFTGTFTGKGTDYGGSFIRPEATGYGLVMFLQNMMKMNNEDLSGKKIAISGSGNVATFAAEKVMELGGIVITMSDTSGSIYDYDGLNNEKLTFIKDMKALKKGNLKDYGRHFHTEYYEGKRPWNIKCDVALPCATQNEVEVEDAKNLIKNGCKYLAEGSNMSTSIEAIRIIQDAGVDYCPGKASNAGGVAVSGLEMTQNSMRLQWTAEEVHQKLQSIMDSIHGKCINYGKEDGTSKINYLKGANIAGFTKVANAMLAQGLV